VVVPSYNAESHIVGCLTTLSRQKADIDYEIIVVDSSTDRTPSLVKRFFPAVNLIHLAQKTMPGEARNIGIKNASADIIAFIDSDCLAPPSWLNSIIGSIDKGYSIVGGAVKNANPENIIGFADFFITFSEFLPGMPEKEIVNIMATCNFVCKKSVFQNIGGFHSNWRAGEDYLFCLKASKTYKLLFNPALVVSHINRKNFSPFFRHQYVFGKYSAKIRRELRLPGSVFARIPVLSLLLPLIRYQRIMSRTLVWNRSLSLDFILCSPFIFAGLIVWEYGFLKECLRIKQ